MTKQTADQASDMAMIHAHTALSEIVATKRRPIFANRAISFLRGIHGIEPFNGQPIFFLKIVSFAQYFSRTTSIVLDGSLGVAFSALRPIALPDRLKEICRRHAVLAERIKWLEFLAPAALFHRPGT